MPRNNRRPARLGWVLIPVILTGLLSLAGDSHAKCGMRGSYWYGSGPWVPEKYRLAEEQQRKIDDIHARYDDKILPLARKLSSKRLELGAYASRPETTPEKIKAYRKKIRDLERKIEDLRVDAQAEVAKILTNEQRDYFGDTYSFWDMGHDDCPMMRGYRRWGYGYVGMGKYHMGSHYRGMHRGSWW